METPILGYKVIHDLSPDDLRSVFGKYDENKVQAQTAVLSNEQKGDICIVKSGRSSVVIPPNSTKIIRCVVHAGLEFGKQMQALFIPATQLQKDGILEIGETLVNLEKGNSRTVGIPVYNTCTS